MFGFLAFVGVGSALGMAAAGEGELALIACGLTLVCGLLVLIRGEA